MSDSDQQIIMDELIHKLDLLYEQGMYEFEFDYFNGTCIEEEKIITCHITILGCQDFAHTVEYRDYDDEIDLEAADILTDLFKMPDWQLNKFNNKPVKVKFYESSFENDEYIDQLSKRNRTNSINKSQIV